MTPVEKFSYGDTFDWEKLSTGNLKIAQKVIKITLDFFQFNPIYSCMVMIYHEIPLQKYEREQVYFDDVSGVFSKIDGIQVMNSYLSSEEQERLKDYICLQVDSFETVHRIRNLVDDKLKNVEEPEKKQISKLHLDKAGDLWREPKTKYCYPMGEKSGRHNILRHLVANEGYQPTPTISSALGGKSEQSIRTEIAKIRRNIKKFLKVDGDQIIEIGKKGSGYRIGSKYKIKIIA